MNFLTKYLCDRLCFLFFSGVFIVSFSSCNYSRIFDENRPVPGNWDRKDLIPFDVSIEDTVHRYNILFHVRNTGFYKYADFYVKIYSQSPSGIVETDSLRISMVDSLGHRSGKGVGDLRDHTVVYKRNIRFPVSGVYAYRVAHAHRDHKVTGIMDLGLTVEHAIK